MNKLLLNKIELRLGKKLKPSIKVLGLDLASKTGYCLLRTEDDYLYLDYSFINITTSNRNERYYYMTQIFNDLIKPDYQIVIEDTFLKWNIDAFKFLSRLGGIIYSICYFKKVDNPPIWIYASSARKQLGLKGNCKKQDVRKFLQNILRIKIENEDICDAIILALNGALKPIEI